MARSSRSRVLTDRDEIRNWAEEHDARPSCVRGTGGGEDIGMIRLDFPGYTGETSLEEISWDDWFGKFDERNLALLVQDETAGGQKSNFNKLVSRETAEVAEEGQRVGQRKRRVRGRARASGSRSRSRSARSSRGGRSASRRASGTSSRRNRRSSGSTSSRRSRSSGSSRSRISSRRTTARKSRSSRTGSRSLSRRSTGRRTQAASRKKSAGRVRSSSRGNNRRKAA